MKIEKQIVRASEDIVHKEIIGISKAIGVESNRDMIERAMTIAADFLKTNSLTEPITLARASFYIAIKDCEGLTEKEIKILIHNNGKTNRWWMYLVPLIERYSKGR